MHEILFHYSVIVRWHIKISSIRSIISFHILTYRLINRLTRNYKHKITIGSDFRFTGIYLERMIIIKKLLYNKDRATIKKFRTSKTTSSLFKTAAFSIGATSEKFKSSSGSKVFTQKYCKIRAEIWRKSSEWKPESLKIIWRKKSLISLKLLNVLKSSYLAEKWFPIW